MKILLVEDDLALGELLKKSLEEELYSVAWVKNAIDIGQFINSSKPDIIVLDLGLPKKDGMDALKEIRKMCQIPVIVSTARDSDESIDEGFKNGADDYIIKPFRVKELILRINAVYKRVANIKSDKVVVGDFCLNREEHRIFYKDECLEISNKEFVLLEALLLSPNKIFSRNQLESKISSLTNNIDSNSVDVHIHSIRKKTDHEAIKTIRGLGYTLGKGK